MSSERAALLNAYRVDLELAVAAGDISQHNADVNLRDMSAFWPTPKILDWAKGLGMAPVPELPPKLGPGYPALKRSLRGTGASVFPTRDKYQFFDGNDPDCEHPWGALKWSGYECNDCSAWYCA